MDGEPTPLPQFAEEALAVLRESVDDSAGLSEQAALRTLESEGFTTADADAALEILELRGYIYRVDSEVHITD
ncbi:hypothetical protein [Haloarchaeobius iranensis]|uniref:Uncharacterized protein n=1 Tax=Haloarchaeobius iranensis TaxID=996166 RepID=A0A1G9ZCD2_9EURY|nr:hypothetical protein [Haloarchaeobius iranensis]SDN18143.1 hypothetical protein SAMN05192554_11911 [Haloarchaeobius iranensis]